MIKKDKFLSALSKRVLLLDGAMGTLLQQMGFAEKTPEVLNLSKPEAVVAVHQRYLNAGADVVTTNTFSANRISLKDFNLEHKAYDFARTGAQIARRVVDEYAAVHGKSCFVAGSMGPTGCSLTLQLDHSVMFDDMANAYAEQAEGLIEGGVDVLLMETFFDTLNAKAAVQGAHIAMRKLGVERPIWLSLTLSDTTGRMLAGHTITDFCRSMAWANPAVISLNCGMGAAAMLPYVKELIAASPCAVAVYPNAGLPNNLGAYDQAPSAFVEELKPILETQNINLVGGCCGTTDEHIAALYQYLNSCAALEKNCSKPQAMNQEPRSLTIVGERCNVWGSKKFRTFIEHEDFENAIAIACEQIAKGAHIIDVNLDAPMIDARVCMTAFLSRFASEPLLVGADVMVDSSDWEVVRAALRCVQGRVYINSISLKVGEDVFLQRASEANAFGASVVVMAADEQGQATTFERRVAICERAYHLLVERLNFAPSRIIFDPNTFAICTGDEAHRAFAVDFLNTTKHLRETLPQVHVISGVSNVSFAFRGNDRLRQAMHAVFIEQAHRVGMDMAIINPTTPLDSNRLPSELKNLLEMAICHGQEVSSELIEWGEKLKTPTVVQPQPTTIEAPTQASQHELLAQSIIKGQTNKALTPVVELLKSHSPLEIISGPLMQTMQNIGEKFAKGEMYLPQILKSAQVMKSVVEYLSNIMTKTEQKGSNTPVVLLATVAGDVHDIGKNICATVLSCNGFEVVDLGVMVESHHIVEQAKRLNPVMIGLSGLITPSLSHMEEVAKQLQAEGLTIPLFVGGATTSALHTALKLAPLYNGMVCWTNDASHLAVNALKLLNEGEKQTLQQQIQNTYEQMRQEYEVKNLVSLEEARNHKLKLYE